MKERCFYDIQTENLKTLPQQTVDFLLSNYVHGARSLRNKRFLRHKRFPPHYV